MFGRRGGKRAPCSRVVLREHREKLEGLDGIAVHYQWKHKKTLSLRVYPDRLVVVRSPAHLSLQRLRGFVRDHLGWIDRRLGQLETAVESGPTGRCPLFYLGEVCEEGIEGRSRRQLRAWYRRQAEAYLPSRCLELKRGIPLLAGIGLTVSLRWMKSRWGSCRRDGRITLNTALMLCPRHLIDYVILHELAHLRVAAHNDAFYRLLESWLPGARAFRKELNRQWSPRLASLHRLR